MSLLDHKDHLSASEVNLWIDQPGLCILQRYLLPKVQSKPVMAVGTAVESGMYQLLLSQGWDAAREVALNIYWQNLPVLGGEVTEEAGKQEARISPMLDQCRQWIEKGHRLQLGAFNATQLKIEYRMDGCLPFTGWLDFAFEGGTDVDLKTTSRLPSAPKADHMRQVALYRAARNKAGSLLYVTEKKFAYYPVTDPEAELALHELQAAALSYQRFLEKFDTAEDALRCLPIDRDSFRFSEEAKLKLEELHL